jgi:hypothetical protein
MTRCPIKSCKCVAVSGRRLFGLEADEIQARKSHTLTYIRMVKSMQCPSSSLLKYPACGMEWICEVCQLFKTMVGSRMVQGMGARRTPQEPSEKAEEVAAVAWLWRGIARHG